MADWTIALTVAQEIALEERTAAWLRTQPETDWTPQLVLETMVHSDLQTELRRLDSELEMLVTSALALPRAQRVALIATLPAAKQARFRQRIGEPLD